jgi:hypothetical protein
MSLLHIGKIVTIYLRRYGQNWPYCRKIEEILSFFLHPARYRRTCDVLFKLSQERRLLKVVSLAMTSNVCRSCDGVDTRSPPLIVTHYLTKSTLTWSTVVGIATL